MDIKKGDIGCVEWTDSASLDQWADPDEARKVRPHTIHTYAKIIECKSGSHITVAGSVAGGDDPQYCGVMWIPWDAIVRADRVGGQAAGRHRGVIKSFRVGFDQIPYWVKQYYDDPEDIYDYHLRGNYVCILDDRSIVSVTPQEYGQMIGYG